MQEEYTKQPCLITLDLTDNLGGFPTLTVYV